MKVEKTLMQTLASQLMQTLASQLSSSSIDQSFTCVSDHCNRGAKFKFRESLRLHKVQERCVKEIKKHGWKFPGTATVKTGKDSTE
jgi:hypothetical protein